MSIFWRRIIGSATRAILAIAAAFGIGVLGSVLSGDGAFDWNGAVVAGAVVAIPVAASALRALQAWGTTFETPPEVKEIREVERQEEEYLALQEAAALYEKIKAQRAAAGLLDPTPPPPPEGG